MLAMVTSMNSVTRAIFLPLTELAVLLPLLMLWVLLLLGLWGGIVGLFLLMLTLPAVFRYQAFVLESCAKGETPGAFDAEFFNWAGSAWTMFPLLLAILVGVARLAFGLLKIVFFGELMGKLS